MMELFVPCTVDLNKHQTTDQRYGLEHINKLLEDELTQLRALKNQEPQQLVLPTVKNRNERNSEVEGLEDYQKRARVEQVRLREYGADSKENTSKGLSSAIAPFAEISHDFPRGTCIIGKGEMPFFQLSPDGHSLSCRFPRLSETRTGKASNHCIKELLDEAMVDNNRLSRMKRTERSKQLSGKLIRSSITVTQDALTDNSDTDDLTNSLSIQYCNMTVRDSFGREIKAKSQKDLPCNNRYNKQTFHLACTRDPIKSRKSEGENRKDDSFCAGSVFLHSRHPQNGHGKRQRMRDKKTRVAGEKTSLPRLERPAETKKLARESCEKCRKRSEQAEQNRIALVTASSTSKQEIKSDVVERKINSRPVNKENTNEPQTVDNKEMVLPLLEYTAYMDQDGSLFLLPGAFTLRKKDYNIWSRKRTVRSHTLLTDTTLPNLVR